MAKNKIETPEVRVPGMNEKPTTEQLKARAYDLLAQQQAISLELDQVNQLIAQAMQDESKNS